MTWCLAKPDWAECLKAGRSLLPDMPLNVEMAEKAVEIFDRLRLPDVVGQPLLREAAGEWQRDLVRAIFGSYDPETQSRHVREFFSMVAKKNSKTSGGAALMLTALLVNKRPRAEFLLIAPTLEIADLAFRQTVGMIEADEVLKTKFWIQDNFKRITYRPTKAFLKIKSFDVRVITGSKPSGVLIDELHVIAAAGDADRVMGQLRGGLLPNPEAFLVVITTQSEREPAGVFKAALSNARRVRDGELDLPILPMLYEFPPGVDWRDSNNWWMVNPNVGKSITIERLIPDYHAAVAAGEHELRRWASQHLNVEIGLALRTDAWPGAQFWDAQADPTITLDSLLERCEAIVVGLDGGGLDDLFGLAVLGRDAETKDWLLWTHAWCHRVVFERRQLIAQRLRDFEAAGELTVSEHKLQDIADITELVKRIQDTGLLVAVAADPANIGEIVDAMAEIDITEDSKTLIGVQQGFRMMSAIKTAERRLVNGTLRHSGSALMAWNVSNIRIEPTATAIRATKQHAGDAKIDVAMAMFDAIEILSGNPSAGSIYNTSERGEGLLVL